MKEKDRLILDLSITRRLSRTKPDRESQVKYALLFDRTATRLANLLADQYDKKFHRPPPKKISVQSAQSVQSVPPLRVLRASA